MVTSKRTLGVLNPIVPRSYLENADYTNYLPVMTRISTFVTFGRYLRNNNSGKFDPDTNRRVNNFVDYTPDMNSDKIVLSRPSSAR